jgi:hypothetical protein
MPADIPSLNRHLTSHRARQRPSLGSAHTTAQALEPDDPPQGRGQHPAQWIPNHVDADDDPCH